MSIDQKADLILENAEIKTLDNESPSAESVAIKNGRIAALGTMREIQPLKSIKTIVIDCGGKTVVPGFIDAHCHFNALVRKLLSIDLSPASVSSINDIKNAVHRKTLNTAAGKWITGTDYNEFYLKEKRHPTRRDLDEAAPYHPVVLCHRTLHACALNSLALKLMGITGETEEPEGGRIERDIETGEPNGVLYNMLNMVMKNIPPIDKQEQEKGVKQADRLLIENGITSFTDATITNDTARWKEFCSLKRQGKITSRISMMPGISFMHEFKDKGLITGKGDENCRIGPLKIVVNETGHHTTVPSQSELNEMVLKANRSGFSAAIHAIEKSCVEAAAEALEYAAQNTAPDDLRNRVEHCSECPQELRKRLADINAIIVTQPSFIYYSGQRYLEQVDRETQQWLYPFRSLIESGLVTAGSSDFPVVPVNPLHGIYAALTRRAMTGEYVQKSEAVSIQQAVEMFTINAAYASGEEKVKGSISIGKAADMLVLSANPFKVSPEEVKKMNIKMTVLGGKIVFEK
jgi:predicted amidohydrolase YtcJ